ncbi:MAG TPA: DUF2911 domain-containing protein [Chitinophagaceae bacterium]|nr:DUF2911 domain-containing protein [Chitinophagaceae bacterium]
MLKRFFFILLIPVACNAQFLNSPPDGDNQYCSTTQGIGVSKVTITYHSTDVTAPDGKTSRRGKIWDQLVPYNNETNPWRGGSNENTTLYLTHDAKLDGNPVKAGTYGVFMIPSENEWTIILSSFSEAWGAFTYNAKEDVLRFKVKPEKAEYHEWLTWDFDIRQTNYTILSLKWEDLKVSFRIEMDAHNIALESFRTELRSGQQFNWEAWNQAAEYCVKYNFNLDEALIWINNSIRINPTFANHITKSNILKKQNKTQESTDAFNTAIKLGNYVEVYNQGRNTLNAGNIEESGKYFAENEKKFPDAWHVSIGWGRYYLAKKDKANAIKYFEKAVKNAPSEPQKKNMEKLLEQAKAL